MPGSGAKELLRTVAMPTAALLLLLAVIVGSVLHVATSRTDDLALKRQTGRVEIALHHGLRAVGVDQEASTFWDDAVFRTGQRPLDLDWIDNNLGVWFHTYYQIDETYLLDPRDQPIYAMADGHRVAPHTFSRIAAPAQQLAATVRNRLKTSIFSAPGEPGQTVGAARIAMVGGRPALLSVKPILSESDSAIRTEGREALHVAVRYLDRNFLVGMGRLYGIENPRFVRKTTEVASVALREPDGRVIGYLTWQPFRPGQTVEERIAPVLLVVLALIGILIALLLWGIQRSRRELVRSRAQAEHLAFHDSLTGLPNRALFENRLKLALSKRTARVTVLLLDLDRFKDVNDTLGHQAGDELIREFGKRLVALTREGDTISRLGGDEFAILVEGSRPADIHLLARRILQDIRRPFDLEGGQVYVGVSIGIAGSSNHVANSLELVRRADVALYRAKDSGRNDYRMFSRRMDAVVKLRGTIEEDLREAIATGRGLDVHYQPLVNRHGTILGVEALLRWHHPTRGLIGPDHFIPIAEECGLIVPLGEWVIDQACRVSRICPEIFVAINLSPIQFRSSGFFDSLMERVRAAGADPRAIQLEVTERVLLKDEDSIKAVIEKLRGAGFRIVLDDFGTGFSSLSYLHKFKVDKIKIDRTFICGLDGQSDCGAIVMAIVAMGHAMGLEVAAEGVETSAQKTFLDIAGCREMQGHVFSRAVPEKALAGLLDVGRLTAAA